MSPGGAVLIGDGQIRLPSGPGLGWVLDDAIDWFRWRNGEFVRLEPNAVGVIESQVFPGLRLDLARLLAGDRAGLVAALRA